MLIPLLITLVVGIVLTVLGWRGRVIDDHPVCSHCGYDLMGMVPETVKCSECGRDIKQAGAIRRGNRTRRAGLLWTGIFLAVPAMVIGLVLISVTLSGWNWRPWAPWSVLVMELKGPDARARDLALTELTSRIGTGSDGDVQWLVDKALEMQANRATPWDPRWGKLIHEAFTAKKTRLDQWERYLNQVMAPAIEWRAVVRLGDPLPVQLRYKDARLADGIPGGKLSVYPDITLTTAGGSFTVSLGGMSSRGSWASGLLGSSIEANKLAALGVGTHDVRAEMQQKISAGGVTVVVKQAKDGTLVLTSDPTITRVGRPDLQNQMDHAFRISQVDPVSGTIMVQAEPLPVDVGFEVWLSDGTRRISAGNMAIKAHGNPTGMGLTASKFKEVKPPPWNITLEPSEAAAAATVDIEKIWDGRVQIGLEELPK